MILSYYLATLAIGLAIAAALHVRQRRLLGADYAVAGSDPAVQ